MSKKYIRSLKIVGLLAIPITLWVLPSDFFDTGQSISVFAWFGIEDLVYSTGMTRAIMHLMHFDFGTASEYNKLSFIVLPLLIMYWLKLFLKEFNVHILKWI